jgi:hypothetical protein
MAPTGRRTSTSSAPGSGWDQLTGFEDSVDLIDVRPFGFTGIGQIFSIFDPDPGGGSARTVVIQFNNSGDNLNLLLETGQVLGAADFLFD